ncbi:type II toxin-antitoxin system ParD family antitoxin [Methylobacterium sp. J-030]|uniref:type II toxin-antitoxin system ParD family antitoxin n=1 Tax=Methylobacterium sp. J-030 TaxID=2836627 RepID=UPI001FBA03BA|nr:type II toxin-antitoxin system ParD family antitoxin [Methylobacterium sp. J-030]MCJ2069603.1 type II toxin-antitoxin system ParD family antitoxin [Methylobacterium sp. J-030]
MAVREPITISVSPELRAFLQGCVATGRYSSVSEVVRAALREFERVEMGKASVAQQAMAGQPPTPSGCA